MSRRAGPHRAITRPGPYERTGMERIAWILGLGIALLLFAGCATGRSASRSEWPADLTLSYHWVGETVPPPDHHEYVITIGPGGGGEITFYPDYPDEGVPEWHGQFVADAEALNTLYAAMLAAGLFSRNWQQIDGSAVGGATEWLRVASEAQEVVVPAQGPRRRIATGRLSGRPDAGARRDLGRHVGPARGLPPRIRAAQRGRPTDGALASPSPTPEDPDLWPKP